MHNAVLRIVLREPDNATPEQLQWCIDEGLLELNPALVKANTVAYMDGIEFKPLPVILTARGMRRLEELGNRIGD